MSPVKEYSSNDDLIDVIEDVEKYKCRPKLFVSQDLNSTFKYLFRDAQQS